MPAAGLLPGSRLRRSDPNTSLTSPREGRSAEALARPSIENAARTSYPLRVVSLAANTVKKFISGNGRTHKEQVAQVIVARFPELKVYLSQDRKWKMRYHENMFDAVTLALTAANRLSSS